jgi:hypothetical protein
VQCGEQEPLRRADRRRPAAPATPPASKSAVVSRTPTAAAETRPATPASVVRPCAPPRTPARPAASAHSARRAACRSAATRAGESPPAQPRPPRPPPATSPADETPQATTGRSRCRASPAPRRSATASSAAGAGLPDASATVPLGNQVQGSESPRANCTCRGKPKKPPEAEVRTPRGAEYRQADKALRVAFPFHR